jgi:hypothetical protein
MASLGSFASTVRTLFRALRYVGLVFTVLAAWFLGKEVFETYQFFAAITPALGVGFLVVFAILF